MLIIYFIVIVVLIFKSYGRNILAKIVLCLFASFIIGFRGENVGVDTENYINHFYTYGRFGCDYIEIGFDYLNQYLFALGTSAHFFLFICALLSFVFITIFLSSIKPSSVYYKTSLLFFIFCPLAFVNGVRQGIACSVFYCSLIFLEEKKFIYYLLLLLGASLFHASVLLLIPLYFLINRNISSRKYILIYIFSFFLLFFDLSSYMYLLSDLNIGNRNYATIYTDIEVRQASFSGFIFVTLLNLVTFMFSIKFKLHKLNPVTFNLFYISCILFNVVYNFQLIGRVMFYFNWALYILVPILLYSIYDSKYKYRLLIFIFYLLSFILLLINAVFSSANMLLDYKLEF